ncbi:leucyl aminopeptidase [Rubellimicrobium sp. CFH 75288]|uniref:leucyl aminopeptidase n=1 Tax=Rubellimicrobium sp. CFH 75288 TaxID=2697034 RepID=UPI0014126FDF|nr:leucyl aminopeptidase [Rubellimicrobium sp. CFH 75288]NAZ35407.1 leucyl aminopeptidase [Rubellimicrobium sp. CFH 75288]
MTEPVTPQFRPLDPAALPAVEGRLALLVPPEGRLPAAARAVDRATRKALSRMLAAPAWAKLKPGEATVMAWPGGLAAEALIVVKAPRRPGPAEARAAGGAIAKHRGTGALTVAAGDAPLLEETVMALTLRAYDFAAHKTGEREAPGPVTILCADPEGAAARLEPFAAVAEGVFFARDLVSEPANVLTTTEFATRLEGLRDLGLEVEVLDEAALERIGMRLLLAVGQGSESPSRVVVMRWTGGGDEAPLALVGKGVCFDTGGISIKPASGMDDMTMDMAGAATVAGVMRTLARRKARANVVGLVGLVENMPSGRATRPGDVVRSLKGDTVEIINTDAEGRLVLADVLWHAQETYAPRAIVNLATLTGAIIVALGHENAGVFSNDDALADALVAAARAEGEGAWRMPMGDAYDAMLKSDVADMKNVGGRDGGSITAAQFLKRFIREGTPWCHIDIAGVAKVKAETALSPKGATGWGVMTLDRLVRDRFEG